MDRSENEKSPVLFIIYNRVSTQEQVWQAIREYRPSKLYIAADGPRPNKEGDVVRCQAARDLVDTIDWNCEVKRLFRDENLGCKLAVSGALTWFFQQEEQGIILEDDCLPSLEFFQFCHDLLNKYRKDERVMHIGGSNLQFGHKRGNASYYFSSVASVWGWASWRRVWNKYDERLRLYDEFKNEDLLYSVFPDRKVSNWLTNMLQLVYEDKVEAWDYRLAFAIMIEGGICITPNENLVSNIGFQEDSTNTKNAGDIHANIPIEELGELSHPKFYIADRQADIYQISHSMPKISAAVPPRPLFVRVAHKARRTLKKFLSFY